MPHRDPPRADGTGDLEDWIKETNQRIENGDQRRIGELASLRRCQRAEADLAAVRAERDDFLRLVRRIIMTDDWRDEVKTKEPGTTPAACTLIDLANLRIARDGFSRECKAVRAERDQLRDAAFDAIQWFCADGTTIGRADVVERLDAALRGDWRGEGKAT